MARKAKVEFNIDTIINNPVTKRQLEGFIEELVLCEQKISSEREAVKDIRNEAKDSMGIPGKLLGKLVRERMNPGSIDQAVHDIEEAQTAAERLGMSV